MVPVMTSVTGTFDVSTRPEPPFSSEDGVLLGRMEFDKVFQGALEATSVVYMTYARTPIESSAGYVAVERIVGTLDGRTGSFVVLHTGLMDEGELSLDVPIVAKSGTGELANITGYMTIEESDGEHRYTVEYELATD